MTKTLIDYANEVENEMGMSGTTAGIYRNVWVEAFVRWQKEHDAVSADLLTALTELEQAVTTEVNEKGGGGYILARLSDARTAIAKATGEAQRA